MGTKGRILSQIPYTNGVGESKLDSATVICNYSHFFSSKNLGTYVRLSNNLNLSPHRRQRVFYARPRARHSGNPKSQKNLSSHQNPAQRHMTRYHHSQLHHSATLIICCICSGDSYMLRSFLPF